MNFNELKNNFLACRVCEKKFSFSPHPSPLNFKRFKDNPQFMENRIIEIRKIIKNTLEK